MTPSTNRSKRVSSLNSRRTSTKKSFSPSSPSISVNRKRKSNQTQTPIASKNATPASGRSLKKSSITGGTQSQVKTSTGGRRVVRSEVHRLVGGRDAPIESSKISPMKTRRLQKSSKENKPRCTLCKKTKGDFLSCATCHLLYHGKRCLYMAEEVVKRASALKAWLCPKCIRCSVCEKMIDDAENVECCECLSAWHGICSPKVESLGRGLWRCKKCSKKHLTTSAAMASTSVVVPSSSTTLDIVLPSTSMGTPLSSTSKKKRRKSKCEMVLSETMKDEVECIINERDILFNELYDQAEAAKAEEAKRKDKARSTSPHKSRSPDKKFLGKIVLPKDELLMTRAKQRLQNEKNSAEKKIRSSEQWIYMGGYDKMKGIYKSPYPDDIKDAPAIYICTFCLTPTSHLTTYRIHQESCNRHHPPGNEIYRDINQSISFFEVDGVVQRSYCRNLCLLAKLFISSKTLHHEVDTFLFYILTENTPLGCRIVGYFSKEKNPSKNNNLSCLLSLPNAQRCGYGRLLIDMSYELSRLERKVGSPEHPLSDLGLFAYRGYWKSSIVCYLRSVRNLPHISIKDMSLKTRIHPTDLVNQLLREKILIKRDGLYYIKTGKRAYKWPLSVFRRRTVDASRIRWKPPFDVSLLDPSKINSYV